MMELLPTDEEFEQITKDLLEGIFKKPIEEIRKDAQHRELKKMVNFDVLRKMDQCYKLLENILSESELPTKLYYEEVSPTETYGAICVEGAIIEILKTGIFARVADFCDTMEVYSLTDNNALLTCGFFDAYVRIK